MSDALERLRALQADDLPVHGGHTLAYVYDSGLPDIDRIGREAVAAAAATNGLDPTAFPSLLRMENDLVGFGLRLLDAPGTGVGTVTSGGTESVLLAVQTARDARPEVERPAMVLPSTRHAAFDKAAHYFGVEKRVVPVGADFRADVDATAAAIRELGDRVVLVVASAPSYAHGVIDPVPELAALAAARGIRCHVDACIGGWVLPYAARLGRPVPPWSFAVEGVTSISVDLHKYGYAPKGTSLLLHRTPELRRPQFFSSADWPGYTMLNSTMQSTKSGGPLAGAWAVVESLGDEGYLTLTRRVFAAVDAIVAGIEASPSLSLVTQPDSSLVTFETDGSCDAFSVCDEMLERGWYVQPQMSYAGQRPVDPPVGQRRRRWPTSRSSSRSSARRWRPRRRPGRSPWTPASRRTSSRSTRPRSPTPTSTACSRRPGWSARTPAAGSPCPAGWPRSTRCSTWPRRRCARRCSSPSWTG